MGLEAYIANLSMNMAQASVATQASTSVMKNVMDDSEQIAQQMIEQMQSVAPPAATNGLGGLLDITA